MCGRLLVWPLLKGGEMHKRIEKFEMYSKSQGLEIYHGRADSFEEAQHRAEVGVRASNKAVAFILKRTYHPDFQRPSEPVKVATWIRGVGWDTHKLVA